MTPLLIKTEDQDFLKAVKDLLKDFQVAFEEQEEGPYDPEFVKKIKQGRQDVTEGKGVKIDLDDDEIIILSLKGHYNKEV